MDFIHKVYFSYKASTNQLWPATNRTVQTGLENRPNRPKPSCPKNVSKTSENVMSEKHMHAHTNACHLERFVLHTVWYEVMSFGSAYIFKDPDLSYLCGISHSFVSPLFLFKLHTHITWYLFIRFMNSKLHCEALEDAHLSIASH